MLKRLGPQSSFMSSELDETVKVMKSVSSLEDYVASSHQKGKKIILEILRDLCVAFQKNHGTGTSSLITYVILLLQLFNEQLQLSTHSHQSLILNSLDLFERIFRKSCNALLIASEPWGQLPEYFLSQEPPQSDPIPDEFSWFFDDSTHEISTVPSQIALDSAYPGMKSNHSSVDQYDQQLFCGLQHSLWWDFPVKLSPSCSVSHYIPSRSPSDSCVVEYPSSRFRLIIITISLFPSLSCRNVIAASVSPFP
jgi:hypothetical protein